MTDGPEMACNLVAELRDHGSVDQDRLAWTFADHCEPYRGYGAGAVVILHQIRDGVPWREAAAAAFRGSGLMWQRRRHAGRSARAYFADDLKTVVAQSGQVG